MCTRVLLLFKVITLLHLFLFSSISGMIPDPYSLAPLGLATPVVTGVTATSATISWLPPSSLNGVLLDYILTIESSAMVHHITVVSSQLQYDLAQLQPATVYFASITASNVAGNTTSEAALFTSSEAGECLSSVAGSLALIAYYY